MAHLADEVEQVLRGEGRRSHHQLVQDAPQGPLDGGEGVSMLVAHNLQGGQSGRGTLFVDF